MLRFFSASLLSLALSAQAAEPKIAVFEVTGMACMLCSAKVKKTLERMPGVHSAKADHAAKRAEVKFDPDKVTVEALAKSVTEAGFKATPQK